MKLALQSRNESGSYTVFAHRADPDHLGIGGAVVGTQKGTSVYALEIGQRVGSRVVLALSPRSGQGRFYVVQCDCGTVDEVKVYALVKGEQTACSRCANARRRVLSGFAAVREAPEYGVWRAMWRRCTETTRENYAAYGGRGIRVCERWRDFPTFLADMGSRPSARHTLDRIDNDGHYEPGNCQWATPKQQSRNQRSNRTLEVEGITRCVADWAERVGLPHHVILRRANAGWPADRAIFTPKRPQPTKRAA